jgi:hypothetical protein
MEFLIRNVRDLAIRSCDGNLPPHGTGRGAAKWRDALARGDLERTIIADAVDTALYHLLVQIDLGRLDVRVHMPEGLVDLRENTYSAGMAGDYVGDGELIASCSEERYEFVDLVPDMPTFDGERR